jgi:diacylglycerol kinase family enzyme
MREIPQGTKPRARRSVPMAGAKSSTADAARPTPGIALGHIEAVVNAASGSVGKGAGAALQAIVAEFGLTVHVAETQPSGIVKAVEAAVKAAPGLVIVLAGDGTARLAAELCGPDGPLVAPLPGGTMNMLPKAIYGTTDWKLALRSALAKGEVREISGGEVGGKSFYVAAILGAPALWADAREAVRAMEFRKALASCPSHLPRQPAFRPGRQQEPQGRGIDPDVSPGVAGADQRRRLGGRRP